ncbi:hypothetical protein I5677_03870 [Mobilitalea sibirica]|uniref:Uncharacterized protein n=1 Tax=Mobilitalea sibirica TaxID=1462919 RepID=A0A8J7KW68_9FIRM|nr:hypothetical protein [Mobilitalea sibirica]MBH1940032.1 hypothetical protein [Mobilitalea sibirica]
MQYFIPYSEAIGFVNQVCQFAPNIYMHCNCEPYCYRDNKLIHTGTKKLLGDNILAIPKLDFQRIRIVFDESEIVDVAQYISHNMIYQASIHNAALVTNKAATKVLLLFGANIIAGAFHFTILPQISLFSDISEKSIFIQGLLLTASNPITIIFWSGVFST